MRLLGLIALIPTSLLLAVSFFVLFMEQKANGGLKTYAKVVAAFLIAAALVVFSAGVYTVSTGECLTMKMMQGCKMKGASMGSKCGGITKPETGNCEVQLK